MRTEEYLAFDFKDNMVLARESRREFLKCLGGGIFIFVSLGDLALAQEAGRQRRGGEHLLISMPSCGSAKMAG
jgi:hypothetical protein